MNPQQFFHVSDPANRESIAKLGLRTDFSADEDMYPNEAAGHQAVYVSKGAPKAGNEDAWKVDMTGLGKHMEPDVEEGDYAVFHNIGPERLKLHRAAS
jgi:hypothetical protein